MEWFQAHAAHIVFVINMLCVYFYVEIQHRGLDGSYGEEARQVLRSWICIFVIEVILFFPQETNKETFFEGLFDIKMPYIPVLLPIVISTVFYFWFKSIRKKEQAQQDVVVIAKEVKE